VTQAFDLKGRKVWVARTSLDQGLSLAYADYLARLKAGAIAA
jgi:hypothetical protein